MDHKHNADKELKKKYISKNVEEYIREESKKKKIGTAAFLEKLEDKFNQKFEYQAVANLQQAIDLEFYGEPTEDAENLRILLSNIKEKFPDFLGEYLYDEETGKLTALIYVTPKMRSLASKYMDLLVMDTTFGTNRFRMKHWVLCGKDNNNRTVIFAEGLVIKETLELFKWLLERSKNYLTLDPKFILIDSDPALISANEDVFPTASLKLCGWHTENNIKNHLYGTKKRKNFFFLFDLFYTRLGKNS